MYYLINWIVPPTITKDTVVFVKGIAIMMMVYLHLFCWKEVIPLYTSSFFIGELPFAYCLSRTMSPTGIFLFLGGFGLYSKWHMTHYSYKKAVLRLPKLYIVYWLIMMIFVCVGALQGREQYPGSWYDVFLNVTAIRATYNREAWFLFPYVSLIVISPLLFKWISKTKCWMCALIALFMFYSEALLYGRAWNWIYDHSFVLCLCRCIEVSCCFVLGALFAKICIERNVMKEERENVNVRTVLSAIVLSILSVYTILYGLPLAPLWYSLMTLLFVNISLSAKNIPIIWQFFCFMGRYSLPIWLLHTYYCRYLFQDFIYSFEYPVLIYIVELIVSTLSAIIIMKCATPIIKFVTK